MHPPSALLHLHREVPVRLSLNPSAIVMTSLPFGPVNIDPKEVPTLRSHSQQNSRTNMYRQFGYLIEEQ